MGLDWTSDLQAVAHLKVPRRMEELQPPMLALWLQAVAHLQPPHQRLPLLQDRRIRTVVRMASEERLV